MYNKDIIICILIFIILCMGCIMFKQNYQINKMQSEIQISRKIINNNLQMMDNINTMYYNNYNYKVLDNIISIDTLILECLEDEGYLIKK